MHRCSLLPVWLLSLSAWGAPPVMPDDAALEQEMARQRMRSQELLRRADDSFRADPGRPVQSTPRLPGAQASQGAGSDPLAVAERYRQAQGSIMGMAETGPDLMVFVSFAMPLASLERLATDAGKTGAVLVFRGPKDGSLRKTLQAFEPLAKRGAKAIIHPEAFSRHRVEAVPVYLLGQAGGCDATSSCKDSLRITGDAGLEYVLERMARTNHPLAREAEARLARLRGAP